MSRARESAYLSAGEAFAEGLRQGIADGSAITLEFLDGSYRMPGVVSAEELEELERMHDAGDIRAEARLKMLRDGRPKPAPLSYFGGTFNNRF